MTWPQLCSICSLWLQFALDGVKGQEKALGAMEEACEVVQGQVCWAGLSFVFWEGLWCQREIQRSSNLEKGHFLLCDRRGGGKKRGKWREICRYNGRKLRWCAVIVSILIFCEIRCLLRTRRKQIIDVSWVENVLSCHSRDWGSKLTRKISFEFLWS